MFGSFLMSWENKQIKDGGCSFTLYDVITSCCVPQMKHFWTYYIASNFIVIALILLELRRYNTDNGHFTILVDTDTISYKVNLVNTNAVINLQRIASLYTYDHRFKVIYDHMLKVESVWLERKLQN